MQAQKAVGEDAAAQEGGEFLLDEAGHGMPAFGRPGQEALELLANRPVEEGLLGAMGGVARTRVRTGERVDACPLKSPEKSQLKHGPVHVGEARQREEHAPAVVAP